MASANQPLPLPKLRIQCRACDQSIVVSAQFEGKKVKCPKCGNVLIAQPIRPVGPLPPPAAPTPALMPAMTPIASQSSPPAPDAIHVSSSSKPLAKALLFVLPALVACVLAVLGMSFIVWFGRGNQDTAKLPDRPERKQNEVVVISEDDQAVVSESVLKDVDAVDASESPVKPPAEHIYPPSTELPSAPPVPSDISTKDLLELIIGERLIEDDPPQPRTYLRSRPNEHRQAQMDFCQFRLPRTAADKALPAKDPKGHISRSIEEQRSIGEEAFVVCGLQARIGQYDRAKGLIEGSFTAGPRFHYSKSRPFIDKSERLNGMRLWRVNGYSTWFMRKDKTIARIPFGIQSSEILEQGGIIYYAEDDLTSVFFTFEADYPTFERLQKASAIEPEIDVAFRDLVASSAVVRRFYHHDRLRMLNNDCQEVEEFNTTGFFDDKGIPACFVADDASDRVVVSAHLLGFRLRFGDKVLVDCHDPSACEAISYPAFKSDPPGMTKPGSSKGTASSVVTSDPKPKGDAAGVSVIGKRSAEAASEQMGAIKFSNGAPTGAELVGVEVTIAKFGKSFQWTAIGAIRPLFRAGGKTTSGEWQGTPHGSVTRIEGKSGYSISGIDVATGGRIMGLNVHFARPGDKTGGQRYSSGWVGLRTDKVTKITCKPGTCVGLFGSSGKETSGQWPTTVRSLGALVK